MKNTNRTEHAKSSKKTDSPASADTFDYLASAASATEFTGLIPSLPQDDAEIESYNDVCPFLPPKEPRPSHKKNIGHD